MASYDYYQNKPLPPPAPPSPEPSTNPYDSRYNTPAPSYYSSQQHLVPDRPQQSASHVTGSPFESVFDDHVYPANSHQSGPSRQYPQQQQQQQQSHRPQDTGYYGLGRTGSEDNMQHADDIPLQNRQLKDGTYPDHVYETAPQRTKSKKGLVRFGELGMLGAGKKIPFVCYTFTVVQIAVFIGELVKNAMLTGSPIMTQPQFNPMIGPSTYVLINMGSRFVGCMHTLKEVNSQAIKWPCPNTTTNDALCSLSELCGFGGIPDTQEPNQWFRFIVPMFLHSGIIHIGFNLLLQLTLGREMEKSIGSIRFFLVYISAGIFGFVMGGNYAATGISSTGASGSLFGIIALTLLDLLYSWRDRRNPVKDLMFIILDIVISFVLGLLPGLDNFSHIGGFLMGLFLGISVLHSPNSLRRRIGEDAAYGAVNAMGRTGAVSPSFFRNPIGFFKGRKPLWWAWWLLRAAGIVLVTVVFIVLLNNFYIYRNTCSWCKFLSCLVSVLNQPTTQKEALPD